jgi:leucyl/phenylalanyl-tRNA--protein transferase
VELTPDLILEAYRRGLFPMADPSDGTLAWYEADPRGIIPLDASHAPRRLLRYMKQFEFAFDRNFEGVIDGCARPVTWIAMGFIAVIGRGGRGRITVTGNR